MLKQHTNEGETSTMTQNTDLTVTTVESDRVQALQAFNEAGGDLEKLPEWLTTRVLTPVSEDADEKALQAIAKAVTDLNRYQGNLVLEKERVAFIDAWTLENPALENPKFAWTVKLIGKALKLNAHDKQAKQLKDALRVATKRVQEDLADPKKVSKAIRWRDRLQTEYGFLVDEVAEDWQKAWLDSDLVPVTVGDLKSLNAACAKFNSDVAA